MPDEPYDPTKHGDVVKVSPAAAPKVVAPDSVVRVPKVVAADSVVRVPKEEPYDPAKHGTTAAPSEEPFDFGRWAATRGTNAVASLLSMGRGNADMTRQIITSIAEKFGVSQEVAASIALALNSANPVTALAQFGPSKKDITTVANKATGLRPQDAPESWGVGGRMLDTGTEAALSSVAFPAGGASSVVRNLVPAFVGGAASEGAGTALKDTPFEIPGRLIAGLVGGIGTGAMQNAATSTARGVANIVGPRASNVEQAAARIIARNAAADFPAPPNTVPAPALSQLLEQRQKFLPGTPLVAAAPEGGNLVGMTRGAFTMKGEARPIITKAAEDFRDQGTVRVRPAIDAISDKPPAEVRVPALLDKAREEAPPIYRQAGVADLPQQILQQKPGAPSVVPSAILGPDGQPIMVTRPGPPVTSVSTNSLVLNSPALTDFIGQSNIVQGAIRRTQKLSDFKNEPVTSMATLDKVYKDLGSQQTAAERAGDYGLARDIRNEKQRLAAHIEAENPIYRRALETYADPAGLADAATLGQKLARSNLAPEAIKRTFDELPSDAHRQEFLGGYAGVLRGKMGATDRGVGAERFWNDPDTRETIKQIFRLKDGQFGPDLYENIDRVLQNDRHAARVLREITKGSTTANKGIEVSDLAAGDAAGTISNVLHKGVTGAAIATGLEWLGAAKARAVEGRTQKVNAEIARQMMSTDPAEAVRTQGLVATAQQQADATARARAGSYTGGVVGGLLNVPAASAQQPGPADRLIQSLLMPGGQ